MMGDDGNNDSDPSMEGRRVYDKTIVRPMMFDRFARILDILLMTEDTPQGRRRWQLLVGIFICIFGFHVLWACGYLEKLGIGAGFAKAGDISSFAKTDDLVIIKQQLIEHGAAMNEVQVKLLKHQIIEAKIQQCNASSKLYFTQRINELMDEYYSLTRVRFDMPACEDLK
jgi:hypothetical protein